MMCEALQTVRSSASNSQEETHLLTKCRPLDSSNCTSDAKNSPSTVFVLLQSRIYSNPKEVVVRYLNKVLDHILWICNQPEVFSLGILILECRWFGVHICCRQ